MTPDGALPLQQLMTSSGLVRAPTNVIALPVAVFVARRVVMGVELDDATLPKRWTLEPHAL